MKTIKGPALFLAQFAGDEAPFDTWDGITRWAADCGYKGVQLPSWDARRVIATRSQAWLRQMAWWSPSCPPICKASLSP